MGNESYRVGGTRWRRRHNHAAQIAEQIRRLAGSEQRTFLLLAPLLGSPFTDAHAHLTGMVAVKCFYDGFAERVGRGEIRKHARPGHRLERQPMAAEHETHGQQTGRDARRFENSRHAPTLEARAQPKSSDALAPLILHPQSAPPAAPGQNGPCAKRKTHRSDSSRFWRFTPLCAATALRIALSVPIRSGLWFGTD